MAANGKFQSLSTSDQCLVSTGIAEAAPGIADAKGGAAGLLRELAQDGLSEPKALSALKHADAKSPAFHAKHLKHCTPPMS